MEFTDLYTVESLQCFNGFHYRGYRVNQSDTDKVNRLIAIIRQEREKNIGRQQVTLSSILPER